MMPLREGNASGTVAGAVSVEGSARTLRECSGSTRPPFQSVAAWSQIVWAPAGEERARLLAGPEQARLAHGRRRQRQISLVHQARARGRAARVQQLRRLRPRQEGAARGQQRARNHVVLRAPQGICLGISFGYRHRAARCGSPHVRPRPAGAVHPGKKGSSACVHARLAGAVRPACQKHLSSRGERAGPCQHARCVHLPVSCRTDTGMDGRTLRPAALRRPSAT